MNGNDNKFDKEPSWMNPENDRKTPYTDQEINMFVDGFIDDLSNQEWSALKSNFGEKSARESIKMGFINMDGNNLKKIKIEDSVQ
jgi:hypothetical protein